jgi:hypothetical protein
MRISPTAAEQWIQASYERGTAKPCSACQGQVSGEHTSPVSRATHPSQAPRLGLWKTSPDSISA